MSRKNLEVCLTPAVFHRHVTPDAITVVIDVLRATSAITTAFTHGARRIIPAATLDEAREYKNRGFLIAAERDGYVQDFADFGNSPFHFTREKIEGQTIVYSTTNGTRTIQMAAESYQVLIASYLNLSAVVKHLLESGRDVILLCAGWKDRVNIEDSLCAGAFARPLLDSGRFQTACDSVHLVVDLWTLARKDLLGYVDKAAQRSRLRDKGLDDCIPYCHRFDESDSIPLYKENQIVDLAVMKQ